MLGDYSDRERLSNEMINLMTAQYLQAWSTKSKSSQANITKIHCKHKSKYHNVPPW
jgi:hypothetical protein